MITIREIAAIAGVSRSTVSLVLNNSPLVKAETREKVLAVIAQTGYVPNSNARSLGWRATKCLGIVILSDLRHSTSYDYSQSVGLFSLNVMQGLIERLADTDYSVIIEYFSPADTPDAPRLPKLLRERKVDGVFLLGGFLDGHLLPDCLATGIPLVAVGVDSPSMLCDSVISDLEGGTYDALMALYRRGRRRIGLMNCPHTFLSAQPRIRAMQRFCQDTGLPFSMEQVIHGEHNNGESACQALRESWQKGARFDGLAAANPQAALGAMRFLYQAGLKVPQDVSVISYEDNSLCGYAMPPLTAVNIRQETMGAEAANMMLSRLQDPSLPVRSLVVPSYMVERESV